MNCLFFYDFDCCFRTSDFTGSTDYALAFIHWTGFFFSIDVNHFEDCDRTCVHTRDASRTFFVIDFDCNHFLHLNLNF